MQLVLREHGELCVGRAPVTILRMQIIIKLQVNIPYYWFINEIL